MMRIMAKTEEQMKIKIKQTKDFSIKGLVAILRIWWKLKVDDNDSRPKEREREVGGERKKERERVIELRKHVEKCTQLL